MDYKKALPLLGKFVEWATPKRVLLLALMAWAVITGITVFEQRGVIVNTITADRQSTAAAPEEFRAVLTPEIKDKISQLVTRAPNINMIGVLTTNLRVNQRDMIYFYSDDPFVTAAWNSFLAARGSTQPVFNTDEKNNLQMVSVINGEFACHKFEDTVNAALIPKLGQKMQYVCRVSLPPYYGEFSGYIMLGLTAPPTDAEKAELRMDAVRLATDIYFKAITKKRGGL